MILRNRKRKGIKKNSPITAHNPESESNPSFKSLPVLLKK
jgi:hypothetical protein